MHCCTVCKHRDACITAPRTPPPCKSSVHKFSMRKLWKLLLNEKFGYCVYAHNYRDCLRETIWDATGLGEDKNWEIYGGREREFIIECPSQFPHTCITPTTRMNIVVSFISKYIYNIDWNLWMNENIFYLVANTREVCRRSTHKQNAWLLSAALKCLQAVFELNHIKAININGTNLV